MDDYWERFDGFGGVEVCFAARSGMGVDAEEESGGIGWGVGGWVFVFVRSVFASLGCGSVWERRGGGGEGRERKRQTTRRRGSDDQPCVLSRLNAAQQVFFVALDYYCLIDKILPLTLYPP